MGRQPGALKLRGSQLWSRISRDGTITLQLSDVEGSAALNGRLGGQRLLELLRANNAIVRWRVQSRRGHEVKTVGDAFMDSFSSAARAPECAIAMHRAFAQHNESVEEPISVRIRVNAGEPIVEEEDLFGTVVILADRIAAKATMKPSLSDFTLWPLCLSTCRRTSSR